MFSKLIVVYVLLLQTSVVLASDCRCKTPEANIFKATPCPSMISSTVAAPAILPAMSYRAITIDDFMSLIGKMAGITVCLSYNTTGLIQFTSSRLQPWPALMNEFGKQNGLEVALTNEYVYLRGQVK